MTETTRRNLLRYGIAIDLVILATGVGMLLPASPVTLIAAFATAVALSVWKGGWKGGLTALVLGEIALVGAFSFTTRQLATMLAASFILGGIVHLLTTRSSQPKARADEPRPEVADETSPATQEADHHVAPILAFRLEAERDARERAMRDREDAERRATEEVLRERARLEAERKRLESELAERLELERHEVTEALRRQLEAERETLRREAEQKLAAEREALAKEAAEREAQREAAAREAAERAQREAAAREAAERAQREAAAREAAEREQREAAAREAAEREQREAAAREAAEREQREAAARDIAIADTAIGVNAAVPDNVAPLIAGAGRANAKRKNAARENGARGTNNRKGALRVNPSRESEVRDAAEREAQSAELAAQEAAQREQEARELAAREAAQREEEAREFAAREAARHEEEARELAAREAVQREEETRALAAREAAQREQESRERAAREAAQRDEEAREVAAREARERAARGSAYEPPPRASISTPRAAFTPPPPLPDPASAPVTAKPAASSTRQTPREPAESPKRSFFESITSWFQPKPRTRAINVTTKRISGNDTTARRLQQSQTATRRPAPAARKPRLLMLERRRGTADAALPRLRQRAVDVQVVERWVDAVDELFRFRPDAMFVDVEHPDFDKAYRTLAEKSPNVPLILTGRSAAAPLPTDRYAAFIPRPYDLDELSRLAHQAMTKKEDLLAMQMVPRQPAAPKPRSIPVAAKSEPVIKADATLRTHPIAPRPAMTVVPDPAPVSSDDPNQYNVLCFSCRIEFNAVDADWCSCLAKERSLVCTNCLACFCKAPPAYKEKFWVEAPPRLFERKSSEARRQQASLPVNVERDDVRRPLVLCVEDDEEIQSIVHRVCSNLGYGFIYAMNGQDGFEMAQEYRPNLILSDAFMPKLDGREMCRMLKEDMTFADTRMVVMTGLYTDTKYRSEALKRFHVDDYVAKPVAITDLINILQKHLEGVAGLPAPEDLHELHRKNVREEEDDADGVPLASLLDDAVDEEEIVISQPAPPKPVLVKNDDYRVTCFNCQATFDATHAEWCRCVGRDNTLLCTDCGGCFCKAPAAYKERFWIDAPPSLFERKMIGSKRSLGARVNPTPNEVKRPLILLVEDDENVQLIVRTVVTNMGFGFVVGANGQEGLSLARDYNPELILSDAFMPKLDGREMCRLLKEDPATSRAKAIIMTGLYTDRKYRNEALDYFKVDDYVAKPLAVDDLIKLFKKHLPQEVAAAQ